jgi:hypothetical protein
MLYQMAVRSIMPIGTSLSNKNYPLGGWTYLAGTPSPMPVGIDQIIARRGIVVVVIHVVAVQHFLLLIMSFRIRCRKKEPVY